ncbi:uncharacterized protein LOC116919510 isoform X2 [Daphnia magna]|uniref:G domain-containing protein n=2 Tax=Daphnia magna TaxID=35525 RepID=A0ABQ9YV93_9CRUS|nr:uncharacterized protein LOC116919510 isoform X2 [Daphnia magna]KAK4004574.1 hypothetical protein OUZ56_006307 [Daphnia magna]
MAGGCDLSGENGGGTNNTKRMTIAFIGAKSVGKTSIIRQFVSNQFSNVVGPTVHPQRYATSLVLSNNRIVEIHISDFPAIDTFPEDSLQEWNLHCSSSGAKQNSKTVHKPPQSFCRLRQASAYVLVFDSSRPAPTFQYIRQMRDQILSHGGKDVYKKPMVVAANKQDLVHMARGPSASATSTWSNRGPLMKSRRRGAHVTHQQTPAHNNNNGMSHSGGGGNNGGKNGHNGANATSSEWSCIVRKQWRCLYVECSAKFNWQVVHLFQQVVNAIESCSADGHRHQSGGDPSRHQLPHSIAQLVHLGQLAHLGGFINVPGAPPVVMPLPPPPRASSPERRRTIARRLQCPVC